MLFTGGHVYNQSKHLTPSEFRNLKAHTIFLCEQFLNRSLQPYEREIFLFPRLCHEATCREWKTNLLNDCAKCGQVRFEFLFGLFVNVGLTVWLFRFHIALYIFYQMITSSYVAHMHCSKRLSYDRNLTVELKSRFHTEC